VVVRKKERKGRNGTFWSSKIWETLLRLTCLTETSKIDCSFRAIDCFVTMGGVQHLLEALVILLYVSRAADLKPPPHFTLGGLFDTYVKDASSNLVRKDAGRQYLAAFVMAVDEINNKNDGIQDELLPYTKIRMMCEIGVSMVKLYPPNNFVNGAARAYVLRMKDLSMVAAVDGSSIDESTSATAQTLNNWGVLDMISRSTSADYAHPETFPLTLQNTPSQISEAFLLAQLVGLKYKWQFVAVFFIYDTKAGLDATVAFQYNLPVHGVGNLGSFPIKTGQINFEFAISQAIDSGATIFAFFLDGQTAGRLLEQGYNAGLFHDGTQVLATSTANIDDIRSSFTAAGRANEAQIMKGFISTAPHPEYHFSTPQGQSFVSRFRKLPPTLIVDPVTKATSCNKRKDASPGNASYIYQTDVSSGVSPTPVCLGFESFSSFFQNGSNIDPYTMFVYDGVYDLVSAIDTLLKSRYPLSSSRHLIDSSGDREDTSHAHIKFSESVLKNISAEDLHAWMTAPTTKFPTRVTGNVSFKGLGGSRTEGNVIKILNYREKFATNDYSKGGLAFVGVFTESTGWLLCDSETDRAMMPLYGQGQCSSPVYRNTPPDIFPADSLPDIITVIPISYKVTLDFFAVVGLLLLSMYVVYVLLHWSEKAIKRSQPVLHLVIFLGSFFGLCKVLLATSLIDRSNCVTQLWFEHFAYRLVLRTILLKLWRVHVIVNSSAKTVRRVVGLKTVLLYIVVDLLIVSFLLVAVTYTTSPYYNSLHGLTVEENNNLVGTEKSYAHNQFTVQYFCRSPSVMSVAFIFYTTLVAFEGVYLLLIAYYIYLSRDLPSTIQAAGTAGKGM
jgi:7 transmembrane sweet-taste receptor of 3 GCPR/Receptor family ligand binding region